MPELVALQTRVPQFETPFEAQGKALQLRQMLNSGQVADMEMQQRRQALADDQAARAAFSANPTDNTARLSALAGVSPAAYGAEAKRQADLAKMGADTRKTELEAKKQTIELAGQAFGFVRNNPTLENAIGAIQHLQRNGVFSPEEAAGYMQKVQSNPGAIKQLAEQAYSNALAAKDHLDKIETRDIGGTVQTLGINPVSGQVRTLSSMAKTQSPDSIASNATAIRGQNLVDARARAQLDEGRNQVIQSDNGPLLVNTRTGAGKVVIGPDGQPLAGVTKPLNEGQSKALLFGTRMQEADKVLAQLSSEGTNTSTPGINAPLIGGVVNAFAGENQQMLNQAKRDFINATLRRESGAAISEGEFKNGEKQYFPQIGDGPKVIEQKAKNRQLAMRGVLAEVPEKMRASITPGASSTASKATAANTNAKGWVLHTDAAGNRAYVSPDGKQFEEVK